MADYNSSYTGAEIDAAIADAIAAPTTYAPIDHANANTTYGAGSGTKHGHVKLSDSTSSTSDVDDGIAATPKAVKEAYDLANGKQSALTFDLSPTQNSSNPVTSGGIYTALQSAGSTGTGATWVWDKGTVQGVPSTFSHVDYVSDTSSNAYPEDGASGGYYYKRLGQVGSALDGGAKSEVVSHVGTGTYGSSNPTIIPFSFVPKIIFVAYLNGLYSEYLSPVLLTDEYTTVYLPPVFGNGTNVSAKMDGTTLYVYASNNTNQMNDSGTTYYFIAIG